MAERDKKFKCTERAIKALASGMSEGLEEICLAASQEAWELVEKERSKVSGCCINIDLSCPFFPIADTNAASWYARMEKRDKALKERERKLNGGSGTKKTYQSK